MSARLYAALWTMALSGGGLAVGTALGDPADRTALWQMSRSAGLVAYALLWGSVGWGLLLSTRVGTTSARPRALTEAHQYLSQLALGFSLFHGLLFTRDSRLELLEPATGAGLLALVLTGTLLLSYRMRQWLGNLWWRRLHYAGFVAFAAAAAHGLAVGTSTSQPLIQAFYLLTVGVIVLLTFYRALGREPAGPRRTRISP